MIGGMVTRYTDDRDLVSRLLRGDEEAFDFFVDEYYPRLYRFAFIRVGSDAEVAQDVVQSTFQKVIPKLRSYRAEATLFSWMCSFCRFEVAAFWRGKGRQAHEIDLVEEAPHIQAALESLAALEEGPDTAVERKEISRLVRVTLDYLPIHYGNVLEWKYIQDLSVRDIAARMETTEKAVESLLTRARSAFRDGFSAVMGG